MTRGHRDTVLVGNGQGFWGDSVRGPVQLSRMDQLDYLTMDFLAEVTMSIMQKSRAKDPSAGYATDFVQMLQRILGDCLDRGIRIIANAGGVNPMACVEACAARIARLGRTGVRVAAVAGDDILDELDDLLARGEPMDNDDSGQALDGVLDRVRSANVYLGAGPIVEALDAGAHIVVTGRVTDPSLTVAPLVHEFGWSLDDHDLIASATVAGHILECGPQATGGNYDRWRTVPRLAEVGYPVVEMSADGTFVVTKPPGTGGLVDVDTVTSQLLYELGDPAAYLTPDVTADFGSVELSQEAPDRIRVSGIRGGPAPEKFKVSISVHEGYRTVAELTVGGPDAVSRARATADILFERLAADGVTFDEDDRRVEVIGSNVLFDGMIETPGSPTEVVLRIAVRGPDREGLDRLGRELASLLTSGPPGLTGFAGGRPRASEVVGFWPALLGREHVRPSVHLTEVTR